MAKEKKAKARPSRKKRERPHRMGMSPSPEQAKMFQELARMRYENAMRQKEKKKNSPEDE